jgi:hypothetical protein
VGGALVGHFAENAIKKHNKDKKEDAYGHSQYGGFPALRPLEPDGLPWKLLQEISVTAALSTAA